MMNIDRFKKETAHVESRYKNTATYPEVDFFLKGDTYYAATLFRKKIDGWYILTFTIIKMNMIFFATKTNKDDLSKKIQSLMDESFGNLQEHYKNFIDFGLPVEGKSFLDPNQEP